MKQILFEGSIFIVNRNINIRIYKEGKRYSFEPVEYLQDEKDMDVYRVGGISMAFSLEDLLSKIDMFKKRYKKIVKSEPNPNY